MRVVLIINDAPYGTEKAYNGLRLAMALQREHDDVQIAIFLMADAVICALPDQTTANGYYNIGRMLRAVIGKGGEVKACGTCVQARGLTDLPLLEGVEISTMSQLAQWVVDADRVITF